MRRAVLLCKETSLFKLTEDWRMGRFEGETEAERSSVERCTGCGERTGMKVVLGNDTENCRK